MSGYGFNASYDAEDRLIGWQRSDSALDQSWDLTPVGDWNRVTENADVQTRTHGPAHELLSVQGDPVQHDAKGNMTVLPSVLGSRNSSLSLSWDFDNRLSSVDTNNDGVAEVFYQFDALGRRVGRTHESQTTVFVQSGQQTIADYESGAPSSLPVFTYTYGEYIDEPVTRHANDGSVRYYHRNQQYSINALTDGAGNVTERYAYNAYGTPTILDASGTTLTTSAANNRFTYTGREYDEALGLYHYRARMYDSVAGRFCSRDPIGYRDGYTLYRAYFALAGLDPTGNAWSDVPVIGTIGCWMSTFEGEGIGDFDSILTGDHAMNDDLCDQCPADRDIDLASCENAVDALAIGFLGGVAASYANHWLGDVALITIGSLVGGIPGFLISTGVAAVDGLALLGCLSSHANAIWDMSDTAKDYYCSCE